MSGSPSFASVRDDLARAYRDLPSVADDARRFAARALAGNPDAKPYMTLGLLTGESVAQVNIMTKLDVSSFDYALDASSIRHVRDGHGDAKGEYLRGQKAVTAKDYARLPELLNAPDSVVYAGVSRMAKRPLVKVTKRMNGVEYVALFEIRTGRKMLALETFYAISAAKP